MSISDSRINDIGDHTGGGSGPRNKIGLSYSCPDIHMAGPEVRRAAMNYYYSRGGESSHDLNLAKVRRQTTLVPECAVRLWKHTFTLVCTVQLSFQVDHRRASCLINFSWNSL